MYRFNAFSGNVNTVNLITFTTRVGIYNFERISTSNLGREINPKEFIEVWKDASLRLILKEKGRNQLCLPWCWLQTGGWDILEKKGVNWEIVKWHRGLKYLCTLVFVFRENFMQNLSSFLLFFLFLFLNFSVFPNYGSNSWTKYTIRLFLMCLKERGALEFVLSDRSVNDVTWER